MLENSPYFLAMEAQRRTGQALTEANRNQLAHTAQSGESLVSKGTTDYRQTGAAWWARVWQTTYRWFRPSNA